MLLAAPVGYFRVQGVEPLLERADHGGIAGRQHIADGRQGDAGLAVAADLRQPFFIGIGIDTVVGGLRPEGRNRPIRS